jgi:hypothetical protein
MTQITAPAPTVTASCVVESDGYHMHFYTAGEGDGHVSIEHDFRTWDSEYTVPAAPCIDAWTGGPLRLKSGPKFAGAYATVADAVAALVPGAEVPELACKVAGFTFPTPYARAQAAAQSLRPTPQQAAEIHRQAACALRMAATALEAAAHHEREETKGIYRARAGELRWQAAEHETAAAEQ